MDLEFRDNNQINSTKTLIATDLDGNQIQVALMTCSITEKQNINFNINIERYDVVEKSLDAFQLQVNQFFEECRQKAINAKMPFIYNTVDALPKKK